MAIKNKCSVCGYNFKPEDGSVCPECLTSRAEDSIGFQANNNSIPNTPQRQTYIPPQQNYSDPYNLPDQQNNMYTQPSQNYYYQTPKKSSNAVAIVVIVICVVVFFSIVVTTIFGAFAYNTMKNDSSFGESISEVDDNEYKTWDDYYADYDIKEKAASFGQSIDIYGLDAKFSEPKNYSNQYNGYTAKEGYIIVGFKCTVVNNNEYDDSFCQDMVIQSDDSNEYYSLETEGSLPDELKYIEDINSGESISGMVYYEIPEKITNLKCAFYVEHYDENSDIDYVTKYIIE